MIPSQPSTFLSCAMILTRHCSSEAVRRISPPAEAALFLHIVTGLGEVRAVPDVFGCCIGVVASGRFAGKTFNVGVRVDADQRDTRG